MFEMPKTSSMIVVINGTNRPHNKSQIFSQFIKDCLQNEHKEQVAYVDLASLPDVWNLNAMYGKDGQVESILRIKEEFLIPSVSWILVVPEYNGSYPGVLKLFFDALSIDRLKETFHHKKVGMVGISDGRAGNLRGMEHLTGMFNYLKMTVFHNKLPISSVKTVLDGEKIGEQTATILRNYITEFLEWDQSLPFQIRSIDQD